jgi:hypothetical protein
MEQWRSPSPLIFDLPRLGAGVGSQRQPIIRPGFFIVSHYDYRGNQTASGLAATLCSSIRDACRIDPVAGFLEASRPCPMMGTTDWLKSRRRWDRWRPTGTFGAQSTGLFLPKLRPRRASVRFTRPVECIVHFVQSHTLDTGVSPEKIIDISMYPH